MMNNNNNLFDHLNSDSDSDTDTEFDLDELHIIYQDQTIKPYIKSDNNEMWRQERNSCVEIDTNQFCMTKQSISNRCYQNTENVKYLNEHKSLFINYKFSRDSFDNLKQHVKNYNKYLIACGLPRYVFDDNRKGSHYYWNIVFDPSLYPNVPQKNRMLRVTVSRSASDFRAYQNQLRDFRRNHDIIVENILSCI